MDTTGRQAVPEVSRSIMSNETGSGGLASNVPDRTVNTLEGEGVSVITADSLVTPVDVNTAYPNDAWSGCEYSLAKWCMEWMWIQLIQMMHGVDVNTAYPNDAWSGCEYSLSKWCMEWMWIQLIQLIHGVDVNTAYPIDAWSGCEHSLFKWCMEWMWIQLIQMMHGVDVNTAYPDDAWSGCEYSLSRWCMEWMWIQLIQMMHGVDMNTAYPNDASFMDSLGERSNFINLTNTLAECKPAFHVLGGDSAGIRTGET